MKKNYFEPEMEWIRFKSSDVIATSTPIGEGEGEFGVIGGDEPEGDF